MDDVLVHIQVYRTAAQPWWHRLWPRRRVQTRQKLWDCWLDPRLDQDVNFPTSIRFDGGGWAFYGFRFITRAKRVEQ